MTDEEIYMSKVTFVGEELITRWTQATQHVEDLKQSLIMAECAVANANNALGKWLMPCDAKIGEVFSVWHGDSLIEVTVTERDPKLKIRSRGKSLI